MPASTPSTIISLIRPTFDRGRASGDLLFFPSEVHTHRDLGIDVGYFNRREIMTMTMSDGTTLTLFFSNATVTKTVVRSFRALRVVVRDQVMPGVAAQA
jgi:hypothetical protein